MKIGGKIVTLVTLISFLCSNVAVGDTLRTLRVPMRYGAGVTDGEQERTRKIIFRGEDLDRLWRNLLPYLDQVEDDRKATSTLFSIISGVESAIIDDALFDPDNYKDEISLLRQKGIDLSGLLLPPPHPAHGGMIGYSYDELREILEKVKKKGKSKVKVSRPAVITALSAIDPETGEPDVEVRELAQEVLRLCFPYEKQPRVKGGIRDMIRQIDRGYDYAQKEKGEEKRIIEPVDALARATEPEPTEAFETAIQEILDNLAQYGAKLEPRRYDDSYYDAVITITGSSLEGQALRMSFMIDRIEEGFKISWHTAVIGTSASTAPAGEVKSASGLPKFVKELFDKLKKEVPVVRTLIAAIETQQASAEDSEPAPPQPAVDEEFADLDTLDEKQITNLAARVLCDFLELEIEEGFLFYTRHTRVAQWNNVASEWRDNFGIAQKFDFQIDQRFLDSDRLLIRIARLFYNLHRSDYDVMVKELRGKMQAEAGKPPAETKETAGELRPSNASASSL